MAYSNDGQSRSALPRYMGAFRPLVLADVSRFFPTRIRGPLTLRQAPIAIDFPQLGPSPYSLPAYPDYPIGPGWGGPWPDNAGGPPHSDNGGGSGNGGLGGGGEGESETGDGSGSGQNNVYVNGTITAVFGAYGDLAGDVSYSVDTLDQTNPLTDVQPIYRQIHPTAAIRPAVVGEHCIIDLVQQELVCVPEYFLVDICATSSEPLYESGELPLDAILFNASYEPLYNADGNLLVSSGVSRSVARAFDRVILGNSGQIMFSENDGDPMVSNTTDDLVAGDTFDFIYCNPTGDTITTPDGDVASVEPTPL